MHIYIYIYIYIYISVFFPFFNAYTFCFYFSDGQLGGFYGVHCAVDL